jgi:hypothetical protein
VVRVFCLLAASSNIARTRRKQEVNAGLERIGERESPGHRDGASKALQSSRVSETARRYQSGQQILLDEARARMLSQIFSCWPNMGLTLPNMWLNMPNMRFLAVNRTSYSDILRAFSTARVYLLFLSV